MSITTNEPDTTAPKAEEFLSAFPKPSQLEKLETLTWKAKHDLREKLFIEQRGICACGCGRFMCRLQGVFASVTLDHITPNKMGCRKQDAAFNLRAVRWECNTKKGSKRIAGTSLSAAGSDTIEAKRDI